ncbi:hypothetical protein CUC43_34420 (plasmid) [Bacillus thuringiensis LM1212]|nr:hypothetical protein CUC43_34420 [Bacillus thuringiensis LM1212]
MEKAWLHLTSFFMQTILYFSAKYREECRALLKFGGIFRGMYLNFELAFSPQNKRESYVSFIEITRTFFCMLHIFKMNASIYVLYM